MALQLGALRDALEAAGADKEAARKASEEVAAYQRDTRPLCSDLLLLKWLVGVTLALQLRLSSISESMGDHGSGDVDEGRFD
ncbi:hypothetical protein [Roseomonas harenae]|uniref:hypothetical protein n=1 Tax=Muricoccus harenae TaxID=2692566 RepID=UPI001916C4E7|nr:hypothetical protein [Roseomonas harenae]